MKIFHIADLHLGKRVNEFDMIDSQIDMLDKIIDAVIQEKPNAIILAGDIYDRSVPSSDAVKVFDTFLNNLKNLNTKVYIIAGNHDSKERLSFASGILKDANYFIASHIEDSVFKDSIDENTDIYMIPFLRPTDVRYALDSDVSSYEAAFAEVMDLIDIDESKFNIMVSHQFITSSGQEPEKSDSEIVNVGGLDNIDAKVFDEFDYVALGHIHRPQSIGRKEIRYAGSILKYSLSEVNHNKSITVLDIENKNLELSTLPLIPKQDMVHIKGYFEEILQDTNYSTEDYTYITLLDEDEIVDALVRLRQKFPYLLSIKFENKRLSFDNTEILSYESLNEMSPVNLFNDFYSRQNNQELSDSQKEFVTEIMEELNETH